MTERLRVLIVDDQRLLCEGFRKLIELEPDLEVVGMAGDGEEALAMVERLSATRTAPDVVLMDVRMPRLDGIAATRAIIERWPEVRVVILTTFDDRELIQAGLQAGALGYVLKDITAEQLATTIRVVAQGQVLLHPDVAHKVLASLSSAPIEPSMTAPATPAFRSARPSTSPVAPSRTTSATSWASWGCATGRRRPSKPENSACCKESMGCMVRFPQRHAGV